MRAVRRRRRLVGAFVATVLLVSCGGDDAEPSTSTETATVRTSTTSTTSVATTGSTGPVLPVEVPERAVWVHLFDPTLTTRSGIEAVVAELAAADVDAVVAQVARRHDAYYDSGYLPPTPDPALEPGLDVLATLIELARPHGIQVHAWISVGPAIHEAYADLTLPDGHVWLEHGPDSTDSWMTVDEAGTVSREHLDPGVPAVRDHAVAIVDDVSSLYDVDGVHLDYVRYDGRQWGYNPAALARFHADTGRDDRPAVDDADWIAWRTAQTEALVAEAGRVLHERRPGALLTAAVIAGGPGPSASPGGFAGTRAAAEMFQDWPAWLADGSVDAVFAMAYGREAVPEQAERFRQWADFAAELDERHPDMVVVGVGAYLNSPDDALAQLALADGATGHVALYSFQQDSAEEPRGRVIGAWPG